jgi:translation initiation factor IF-1
MRRMALKEEKIEAEGEVVEALPSTMSGSRPKAATRCSRRSPGKMRKHYIRILPGDEVKVELSRGRITYRYR